jgi:hypothetical protein
MSKKIVCIWEIGAGLGHLTRLRPIVRHATAAGHQVFLIAKQLHNIQTVFDIRQLTVLQAPHDNTPKPRKIPISWCEMLLLRYQNSDRLANFLAAWRSVLDLIEPDLVVYDSAPTALIASLGGRWTKWTVGSPFFMPRIDTAQVGVFPNADSNPNSIKRLENSEAALLSLIGKAHETLAWQTRLARMHDLLAQADLQMVTTLPQFDYLGTRQIGEFVGMPASIDGQTCQPAWPWGSKPKVFAYLKAFHGMRALLGALEKSEASSIIYSRDISAADKKKFASLTYLDAPASMDAVCAEADLVIHMAGSQTVARCMTSGVTQLLITTAMEQLFTAKSAQQLGAAFVVHDSSANFELFIRQALLHARKGRRPFADARPELLDGSFYDARVATALAELQAR